MSTVHKVFQSDIGKRLDVFLRNKMPGLSRAFLQSLIRQGKVLVNNKPSASDYAIKPDDVVLVGEIPEQRTELIPQPEIPDPILYEDTELLVVNKPPGLVTHPLYAEGRGTLANWLVAKDPALSLVGDSPVRPGLVHRLDKETSGVMVVAKTKNMFAHLKSQFKQRQVEKTYTAILEGIPQKLEGCVEGYMSPSPDEHRRKRFHALPLPKSSKFSRTRYVVERRVGNGCLATFFPETGRTHQIRVHAASLGTPVLGDRLYGAKTSLPAEFGSRFFLHAARLSFTVPDGRKMFFSAPLPEDFERVLQWLLTHES